MKIILAGSPNISIDTFENVINNFDVKAIITQPDKKQGRGMLMKETEVSVLAKKYGIKTFKPEKILDIYSELKKMDYDLLLTFAYGQYIPTNILSLGNFDPINIHGSILPKYRGAAPIHHAILNEDKEIGITLIEMTKEMDAGKIFFKASQEINEETTTGEGMEIISNLAKNNIVDWLKKIKNKEFTKVEQGKDFSLAPKIEKGFAELKFSLTKEEAMRKIKGLSPFPCAFLFKDNKRLKIFNASFSSVNNAIELNFSNGIIFATEYQFEGKNKTKT